MRTAGNRATRKSNAGIGAIRLCDRGCFYSGTPFRSRSDKRFMDFHPEHPVQPIAYTHKVHLAKGLQCTFCHVGVDQGPEARIPG